MSHSGKSNSALNEKNDEMVIMPIGGGQEVGRSCILLQYQNRQILLDCGCHPGREGSDSLPFFDSLEDIQAIDLILITHFHIDHCAALPYFTQRTKFRGKVYMTHATKAVMRLLLADNIRLQSKSSMLYTEQDLQDCIDKVEVIDFYQTIEYRGIKFTPTPAGHVLGAAMFTIEIDHIRILYTGDYSLEEDRHLSSAELPPGGPPDVLICESTFGITTVPSKEKRELEFTSAVEQIVNRGGSCLIPVFALGRAQELLLILDEYWREHPHLQGIPIFYASKLATRSLRVYQTFVNMMNSNVRYLNDVHFNPFKLQYIKSLATSNIESLDSYNISPSVVMASPGFLQSGISRQLFEAWCDDEKHGVIIAGYTIEGTLAHELLSMPDQIRCQDNSVKSRKCSIDYISFSAHVDYAQNKTFIKRVLPDYIILVHGEKTQMLRLKEALEQEKKTAWPIKRKPEIATPENGMKVRLKLNKKYIVGEILGEISRDMVQAIEEKQGELYVQYMREKEQKEREQQSTADAVEVPTAVPIVANSSKGLTAPLPPGPPPASVAAQATKKSDKPPSGHVPLPPNTLVITENFHSMIVSTNEIEKFTTNCKFSTIYESFIVSLPKETMFLFRNFIGSNSLRQEAELENQAQDKNLAEQVFKTVIEEDAIESLMAVKTETKEEHLGGRQYTALEQQCILLLEIISLYLQPVYQSLDITISLDYNQQTAQTSSSAYTLEQFLARYGGNALLIEKVVHVSFIIDKQASTSSHYGGDVMYEVTGLKLTWKASPLIDSIADSAASLLLQLFSTTALVKNQLQSLLAAKKTYLDRAKTGDKRSKRSSTSQRKKAVAAVSSEDHAMEVEDGDIQQSELGGGAGEVKDDDNVGAKSLNKAVKRFAHPLDDQMDPGRNDNKLFKQLAPTDIISYLANKQYNPFQAIENIPIALRQETLDSKDQQGALAVGLDQIRNAILDSCFGHLFAEVALNKDRTKLLFRGHAEYVYALNAKAVTLGQYEEAVGYSKSASASYSQTASKEAYVFIYFDTEETSQQHHAVIYSDDAKFQEIVTFVLKHLEQVKGK